MRSSGKIIAGTILVLAALGTLIWAFDAAYNQELKKWPMGLESLIFGVMAAGAYMIAQGSKESGNRDW